MQWKCVALGTAREPFVMQVMLLVRALRLGSFWECPPFLRLQGANVDAPHS